MKTRGYVYVAVDFDCDSDGKPIAVINECFDCGTIKRFTPGEDTMGQFGWTGQVRTVGFKFNPKVRKSQPVRGNVPVCERCTVSR